MSKKPTNAEMKRRAKKLRASKTEAELFIECLLEENNIKFFSQRVVGWYIADILLANKKVIIELDGQQHYTVEGLEYDKRRDSWLKQFGFSIIRISNNEKEQFSLEQLSNFPSFKENEIVRCVKKANKERNRALYYPPVQQDRYKNKRKRMQK